MIMIVDYGMGNVRSVRNVCEMLGFEVELTSNPSRLNAARGIILPGVGAFGDGMTAMHERRLVEPLREQVRARRKPLLGLCLGMQMLANRGTEHGNHEGLGLIDGLVDRIPLAKERTDVRLPHIGWNTVHFKKRDGQYKGFGEHADFYFVHSFALEPQDRSVVSGTCEHGVEFVASIQHENIWATQFHPEKSHKNGIALFTNWMKTIQAC